MLWAPVGAYRQIGVSGALAQLSAAVFAAILLNERTTTIRIIGAACMIGGAMVGELMKPRREKKSIPVCGNGISCGV